MKTLIRIAARCHKMLVFVACCLLCFATPIVFGDAVAKFDDVENPLLPESWKEGLFLLFCDQSPKCMQVRGIWGQLPILN